MFIGSCLKEYVIALLTFVAGDGIGKDDFVGVADIRDGKPQVTFAGRSNVGKSSVINRLLGRKNYARVGATPGKTSQINYFDIDGRLYFTDLPGYGYAKVSKEERDRWGRRVPSVARWSSG